MLSFEMDVGEPLAVDTPMNRFCRTLFGKKKTLFVGCAAILLGIVMLSLTVMKFSRHKPITHIPRETLVHLVQSRLSSISFDSPTSPESKALDWMVNVDEFDHTAVLDDRLVQRFAMVAMVYSLNLEGERHMLTSESVCRWVYEDIVVFSCNDDDVLESIAIVDNFESGNSPLPASIGLLTGVITLVLSDNLSVSTIPTEIGLLTGLTDLDLYENWFTGAIPTEIGLLTSLTNLEVSESYLTGTTPTEIGLLTGLTYMCLRYTGLNGSFPTEIGLLTSLTTLRLYGNELTGTIPTEIGLLTGLTTLDLSWNDLTGSIATEIGLLTSLDSLYLFNNKFTGSIPTEIELLTSLLRLHLYNNTLTGPIPTRLCRHPFNSFHIDCDKITCSCCKDNKGNPCPANR